MNVPLTTIAARLERAIHADVGIKGLKTLLYGWRMKYHFISDYTFKNREKQSGEAYLTTPELHYFSKYCGYDLTRN